jgi:hypothetical protein
VQGYRYPVEIISHCVWLYHRFPLSLREVEEMMMARGVARSTASGSTCSVLSDSPGGAQRFLQMILY